MSRGGVSHLIAAALIAAGAAAPALASDVDVSVPRSQLAADQGAEPLSVTTPSVLLRERYGEAPRLEIGVSGWVPSALKTESRLGDASPFSSIGFPRTSFAFLTSPIARLDAFRIAFLAGVSFEALSRSGTFAGDPTSSPRRIEESFYLLSLRLGAEATLSIRGSWLAYGGLALVPASGFTTSTVFDDGEVVYGLPLQLTLGAANDLSWISQSLRGVLLKGGIDATVSALTTADFSGLGVEAGVSLPL